MPAQPNANETIRDGGLGLTSPASMMPIVIGLASLGTPNTLALFSSTSQLRADRGYGPGVEHGINILGKPAGKGGGPIGFVGVDPSVAASNGQVVPQWQTAGTRGSLTQSGAGPVVTIAGDPLLGASLRIEITTGDTLASGAARFRWSINGGSSWVESNVVLAATVELSTDDLDTGITATFPAGTYVLNETYTWPLTAGGGEIAVSGDANYDARVLVEVLLGGANGTARFRYCIDGFDGDDDQNDTGNVRTYSESLLVPSGGTFAIPGLGITLTFDDSPAFVDGDIYTCDVQCAAANASDLAAAFAPILAATIGWRFVTFVTSKGNGNAAAHAVLVAALQSQLDTLVTTSRNRRGMTSSGIGASAASVVTAFASTSAIRVLVAHGEVRRNTPQPFPGFANPVTSSLDCFAARAAGSLPSTDLKRKLSGTHDEVIKLFHNETLDPSQLDDTKIATMRTYHGSPGFYINQARVKSPAGSDFTLWHHGILMDIACEAGHTAAEDAIGRGFRTQTNVINSVPFPGVIHVNDRTTLEADITRSIWAQLGGTNAEGYTGLVQDVRVIVSPTHNYQQTGVIQYEVGILRYGDTDYVVGTYGFVTEIAAAA